MTFFTFTGLGWNCSEMVVSGWNFCFNSKPSFSFDSIGQRINFLLLLQIVSNTKRIGLESKPTAIRSIHPQDICLSVPSRLSYTANEIPVSFPYSDTGTIRESYRNVIGRIPGFLWERDIQFANGLLLF
ncbi:MAG: hypothetical protein M0R67_08135 [Candidatus Cloacimonas sp.]|nr:hypothetical protein [Candidatus Cloacimonas sp.]